MILICQRSEVPTCYIQTYRSNSLEESSEQKTGAASMNSAESLDPSIRDARLQQVPNAEDELLLCNRVAEIGCERSHHKLFH